MYVSIVDYGTGNLNSVSKALEVAAEQKSKKINIFYRINQPITLLIIKLNQRNQFVITINSLNYKYDSLIRFKRKKRENANQKSIQQS